MQNSSMLYRLVFGGGWCGWSLCVHIFWGKLLVDVSNWQATQAILLLVSTKTIILQIFRSRLPFPPPKKKKNGHMVPINLSLPVYICLILSPFWFSGSPWKSQKSPCPSPQATAWQVSSIRTVRANWRVSWHLTIQLLKRRMMDRFLTFWRIYLSGKPCYLALVTRSFIHLWFFFMHSDVTWLLTQWDLPRTTRPQTRELIKHCRGIVSRSTMSYSDLFHLHTIHNS